MDELDAEIHVLEEELAYYEVLPQGRRNADVEMRIATLKARVRELHAEKRRLAEQAAIQGATTRQTRRPPRP